MLLLHLGGAIPWAKRFQSSCASSMSFGTLPQVPICSLSVTICGFGPVSVSYMDEYEIDQGFVGLEKQMKPCGSFVVGIAR